jgi:hypothetical protein
MTETLVSNPIVIKAEQRQLVWRFVLSFGVIAGTVAVATMAARWMR